MRITLNGDPTEVPGPLSVQALLEHLVAIATGATFPEHGPPEAVVRRVKEEHSPHRHIECLRRIFASLVRGRAATTSAPRSALPV